MFHSFGFTVTGLLPLLAGLRVVHHADPTDAAALARKVAAYRPTLVVGTPAFIEHLLDRARPGELDSLRLILVGAEKCPDRPLREGTARGAGGPILEGYGVTECSPVIAVNRPGTNRPGSVGRPLPGVEVCVTDLETDDVLPPGSDGHAAGQRPLASSPAIWGTRHRLSWNGEGSAGTSPATWWRSTRTGSSTSGAG